MVGLPPTHPIVPLNALHHCMRALLQLSAHLRVFSQELLQLVVIIHEATISQQRGIFAQTLCDSRVRIEEAIEFSQIGSRIEVTLPCHHSAGVFPQLPTNAGIVAQKLIELVVAGNPLAIVSERWIIPQILREPWVLLQKLMEVSKLAACEVILR